jgi:RNA polymerase sigma factor (sigma-70 family)
LQEERDVSEYEAMRRALLALPVRQRAAIVLRYYEDLPEAQIAELLRCRPATVRSLVSRGLDTLRRSPEVIR